MPGEVPSNHARAIQASSANFFVPWMTAVKNNLSQHFSDLKDELAISRRGPVLLSDILSEVLSFSSEVAGSVENQLGETRIAIRFANEPLISVLPIVAISTILGTVTIAYSCFCIPAMHLSHLGASSIFFHSSFCMAVVAYYQGIVTHPGGVPSSWKGQKHGKPIFVTVDSTKIFAPIERKRKTQAYRYCNKELKFKPDRAHYCKSMLQNILRMDHFCPWLVNAVGHRNHKYFFLFIFYDVLCVNFANISMLHALHSGGHSAMYVLMLSQGVATASISSGIVTPFFIFHCWLLQKNMTTIEFCEGGRCFGDDLPNGSPYDCNLWHNIVSVFGPDWYTWLLPWVKPTLGTGLDWEVSAEFEQLRRIAPPIQSMVNSVETNIGPTCGDDDDEDDVDEGWKFRQSKHSNSKAPGHVLLTEEEHEHERVEVPSNSAPGGRHKCAAARRGEIVSALEFTMSCASNRLATLSSSLAEAANSAVVGGYSAYERHCTPIENSDTQESRVPIFNAMRTYVYECIVPKPPPTIRTTVQLAQESRRSQEEREVRARSESAQD